MLIPKESILKNLPVETDRKVVLYLDGIRFSAEIIEAAYYRLETITGELAADDYDKDNISRYVVDAVTNAWGIVDCTHRLRELIQQAPGLKQKLPEVQQFVRRTEPVEDLRHFVQHFRNNIHDFVEQRSSLWGNISWSEKQGDAKALCHMIVSGTYFSKNLAGTPVFDTHKWEFIGGIVLAAGGKSLDLTKTYRDVHDFMEWLQQSIGIQPRNSEGDVPSQGNNGCDAYFQFGINKSEE